MPDLRFTIDFSAEARVARLNQALDQLAARLFIQYCRAYWREPLYELEPPRRPPSWYPGQPDPPRTRVDRCSCIYQRHYAYTPYQASQGHVRRYLTVVATGFVIDEQCTHHGIAALEHDDAYPDGGVWGFTIEDC